jgi:hypothetical protein
VARGDSERPVYPRWSAYLSIFVSFFMFEAALILFFKTGPFSQNGLLVFYVPMVVFFAWVMVFSILALKAINAEAAARAGLRVLEPPKHWRARPPGEFLSAA